MRLALPFRSFAILAIASLALAEPAVAQSAKQATPEPDFPKNLQFPLSTKPSQSEGPAVSQKKNSYLSTSGSTIVGDVNWTGFYVGGQLGAAFGDSDFESSDESAIGGVTLGYDYDFGRWVLGGALDYDFTNFDIAPGSSVEEIFRVKLRGGPKIGRGLLYGTGGYAYADSDNAGDEDGWFVGGGYEYMVNDQFSVGSELLYHEFDGFDGTGNDVEATTLQIRATFRF